MNTIAIHPGQNGEQRIYQICLSGAVDGEYLLPFCPSGLIIERSESFTLLSNIHTDQSGIVGLIRNLHNLGLTILSMNCC
jgi:hypothetical protein